MKKLSQQLKQAFDALEFANVSQLNELNARLNQKERTAPPVAKAQPKASTEHFTIRIATTNSHSY